MNNIQQIIQPVLEPVLPVSVNVEKSRHHVILRSQDLRNWNNIKATLFKNIKCYINKKVREKK